MTNKRATFGCCGAPAVAPLSSHKCIGRGESAVRLPQEGGPVDRSNDHLDLPYSKGKSASVVCGRAVAGSSDHAAHPARSRFRATPTVVNGWRFRSKTEAALYAKACRECAMVLPPPRFPLACLASPGEIAPVYTPDLLVVARGALGGWVEAWEAKGPKACESRDYALRARAFRQSWPMIPLRVFRMVKGRLVEDATVRAAVEG